SMKDFYSMWAALDTSPKREQGNICPSLALRACVRAARLMGIISVRLAVPTCLRPVKRLVVQLLVRLILTQHRLDLAAAVPPDGNLHGPLQAAGGVVIAVGHVLFHRGAAGRVPHGRLAL